MNEKNLFEADSHKEKKKTGFTIEFEPIELETLKQNGEIEKVENISGPLAFEVGDIFHVNSRDSGYEVEIISTEETADPDEKRIKFQLIEKRTGFTLEFKSAEMEIIKQGREVEKIENISEPVAFEVGNIFHVDSSDSGYDVEIISVEETENSDEKLIKYQLIKGSDE